MRFILATLLTLVFSFILGLYTPWWSLAIVAFLVALLIRQPVWAAFIAGFLGVFLLWGLLALWIDMKNNHVLSQKLARLFPLEGSSISLILVTAAVGGLVAGFAALSGSSARSLR